MVIGTKKRLSKVHQTSLTVGEFVIIPRKTKPLET